MLSILHTESNSTFIFGTNETNHGSIFSNFTLKLMARMAIAKISAGDLDLELTIRCCRHKFESLQALG